MFKKSVEGRGVRADAGQKYDPKAWNDAGMAGLTPEIAGFSDWNATGDGHN